MPAELHTSINNSVSKQQFSFSKSSRFPDKKGLNQNVAYDMKEGFMQNKYGGAGRAFYSTQSRFDYYNSKGKQEKAPHPSPMDYPIRDTFGKAAPTTNQRFSMGIGRSYMKKMYVDDIQDKKDLSNPGPGKYEMTSQLGKKGRFYSMASHLPHGEQALARSKKLPGPGSYGNDDLTGKNLKQSVMRNTQFYKIGGEERFAVPTRKVGSPAPDVYKPLNNLNENFNSTFTKAGQTVFGKNEFPIIDQHFKLQIKSPGPGKYQRFSDFSGNH